VLQERQVVPLGAERPLAVDVRVCSATHGSLGDSDRFRPDLLARLRGLELHLPPLRARMEDLGLLLQALLRRRQQPARFKVAALRALFAHAWPENVRELDQVLGSALALADGAPIDRTHLPARVGAGPAAGGDRPRPLQADELTHRSELVRLLREHQGNIAADQPGDRQRAAADPPLAAPLRSRRRHVPPVSQLQG
jgi:transcriptional regulator of acetoin/glycerol metabolism